MSWGAWSACSETCGTGTRSRKRECLTPIPAGSEEACYGGEIYTEPCLIRHCPGKSHFLAFMIYVIENVIQLKIVFLSELLKSEESKNPKL